MRRTRFVPFVIFSLTRVESLQDAIVIQQGDEGAGCHLAVG
jgi:hypothetical protein